MSKENDMKRYLLLTTALAYLLAFFILLSIAQIFCK